MSTHRNGFSEQFFDKSKQGKTMIKAVRHFQHSSDRKLVLGGQTGQISPYRDESGGLGESLLVIGRKSVGKRGHLMENSKSRCSRNKQVKKVKVVQVRLIYRYFPASLTRQRLFKMGRREYVQLPHLLHSLVLGDLVGEQVLARLLKCIVYATTV